MWIKNHKQLHIKKIAINYIPEKVYNKYLSKFKSLLDTLWRLLNFALQDTMILIRWIVVNVTLHEFSDSICPAFATDRCCLSDKIHIKMSSFSTPKSFIWNPWRFSCTIYRQCELLKQQIMVSTYRILPFHGKYFE